MHLLEHKLSSYLTKNIVVFNDDATVREVQKTIKKNIHTFESIDYVFVVNDKEELVNVIAIRQLFGCKPSTRLRHVKKPKNIVTVKDTDIPEKASLLAVRFHLKGIPVIDSAGHFIGAVCNLNLSRILYHETHDDLLRKAGLDGQHTIDNILEIPILTSFYHRVPWLLLGLMGGIATAQMVAGFESTLRENIILAAFIPLIVYMSDAVGTQIEAFAIRDFALDHKMNYFTYFLRQFGVVVLLGLLASLVTGLIVELIANSWLLGIVLSISLFLAITSSVITGLLIPYLFSRINLDPANASGPIATIIQDFLSVLIYFTVASVLLT